MAYWRQLAEFLLGAVRVQRGQLPAGIAIMRAAIDDMQASGGRVGVSYLLCLLAEAQLAAGRLADARATLNDGVLLIAAGRNDLHAAEAHRIEGRIVLADDPGPQGRAAAKRCFQAALATARRKGARALELRAAVALARLLADEGDPSQAAALLAPVINGFAEGLETADLAYAHSLLEALIGAANAGHAAPVKAARRPRL
jgi:adenylate cyclase